MWKCKKCNEYRFNDTQVCSCKEFSIIDHEGDDFKIQAINEEDAAVKFAKQSNENNDYYLINSEAEIKVNEQEFLISAQPDVYYSARKI